MSQPNDYDPGAEAIRQLGQHESRFVEAVKIHIEPQMKKHNFTLSSWVYNEEDAGVVFEYDGSLRDYLSRFPSLNFDVDYGGDDSCIDFWVYLDRRSQSVNSDLEGDEIYKLLNDVLHAPTPQAAKDEPLEVQVEEISHAVDRVLTEGSRYEPH